MTKMPEHILEEFVRKNKGVWPDDMWERYVKFSEDYDEVYYGDYKAVCEKLGWKMVYTNQVKDLHLPQKIVSVGCEVTWDENVAHVVALHEDMAWTKDTEGKFRTIEIKYLNTLPSFEEELYNLIVNIPDVDKLTEELLTKFNITPKEDTNA